MRILIIIIFIVLSFYGCCTFKSKADIYQWSDLPKNHDYYFKNGNLSKNLSIKIEFKKSYYPYESKEASIILINSGTDTVLVNGFSYNFDLYDQHGNSVEYIKFENQVISTNQVEDECGRKIIPARLSNIKVPPKEIITFDSVMILNRYGDKFANDLLHKAGYIPLYLKPGKYKATYKHLHQEISEDLKPHFVFLKADTVNVQIVEIPDSLNQETRDYINLVKSKWIKNWDIFNQEVKDFKNKYPGSIYKDIIQIVH